MPNWCENYARITVPNKQEADKFEAVLLSPNSDDQDPIGLCGYILPMPKTFEESVDPERPIMPDWYTWRVSNWGTKWEVSVDEGSADIEENDDGTYTFNLHFDSAWSPPVGVYEEIASRDGWDVFATYIEGGMSFIGYFEDGENYSYDIGDRKTTGAPDWLVDDYSWHYDYIEECEQEEDVDLINQGQMTEDQFLIKWGSDVYNTWEISMKKDKTDA